MDELQNKLSRLLKAWPTTVEKVAQQAAEERWAERQQQIIYQVAKILSHKYIDDPDRIHEQDHDVTVHQLESMLLRNLTEQN